jgi:hypothetical protein
LAATFSIGAVVPLVVAALSPTAQIASVVAMTPLRALAVLNGPGASAGGAGIVFDPLPGRTLQHNVPIGAAANVWSPFAANDWFC